LLAPARLRWRAGESDIGWFEPSRAADKERAKDGKGMLCVPVSSILNFSEGKT